MFTETGSQLGRFSSHTCPCGEGVETLAHVLLFCSFYREVLKELIYPLLAKKPACLSNFYVSFLLAGPDEQLTVQSSKFLAAAIKIKPNMILK